MTSKSKRACYISTSDLANLNDACVPLRHIGMGVFLVGSVRERADFRDVDVRLILEDDEFDRRFGDARDLWSVTCRGIAAHLQKVTGLPIDFQIQRMTEANEKWPDPGKRNPLGIPSSARPFAGGGDATSFRMPADSASAAYDCSICGNGPTVAAAGHRLCDEHLEDFTKWAAAKDTEVPGPPMQREEPPPYPVARDEGDLVHTSSQSDKTDVGGGSLARSPSPASVPGQTADRDRLAKFAFAKEGIHGFVEVDQGLLRDPGNAQPRARTTGTSTGRPIRGGHSMKSAVSKPTMTQRTEGTT